MSIGTWNKLTKISIFICVALAALPACVGPAGTSIMMEKKTEYKYFQNGQIASVSYTESPHKDSERIAAGVGIAAMGGNGLMMAIGAAADHVGEAIAKTINKPEDILFLGKSSDENTTTVIIQQTNVNMPVGTTVAIPATTFGDAIPQAQQAPR